VLQKAPSPDEVYAAYYFIGTAHALRRDVFLSLAGYREILHHQGEEEDYCIRMLNAGWVTRCGNADHIHHFESARRSWTRMDYYGARNKILYAWHNAPFPAVVPQLAGTTVKTLVYSLRPNRLWTRFRGLVAGYALCINGRAKRQPVKVETYSVSQALKRRGPIPQDEITKRLPEPSIPPMGVSPDQALAAGL
jgi:GT2 family glycosyltransferase